MLSGNWLVPVTSVGVRTRSGWSAPRFSSRPLGVARPWGDSEGSKFRGSAVLCRWHACLAIL